MHKPRNKFVVLKVNGKVEDIVYESPSDIGVGKEGLEAEYKKESVGLFSLFHMAV